MKKKIVSMFLLSFIFISTGCGGRSSMIEEPKLQAGSGTNLLSYTEFRQTEVKTCVTRDEKYNAAKIPFDLKAFEEAGFQLGDSCDVEFENGTVLEDVPLYNGYYVQYGDPIIVAYPGFDYLAITLNSVGVWEYADLQEGDAVTIRLREAGKYSDIQEALGQLYSFDRQDYDSDEEFCNFRALTGGNLKESSMFRGASPVDNSRGRAAYTDKLLEENQVEFVLDLADTEENMISYLGGEDFNSPYTAELYKNGKIAFVGLGSAFQSEEYKEKLVAGLKQMAEVQGNVYIHCMEGKDRTGFVCCLLEALAGASYEEMLSDYMITYRNYFDVSEEETPEKYQAIADLYFDAFVSFLHGTDDKAELVTADYRQDAINYLTTDATNGDVSFLLHSR